MRASTHHNGNNRGEDNNVTRQESGQTLCTSLNLPGSSSPSPEDSSDKSTPLNIKPFRSDEGQIVGRGDRVGGNVCTKGSETKSESDEKGTCPVGPLGNDGSRIPVGFTVNGLTSRCNGDTDERESPVDDWDVEKLPP